MKIRTWIVIILLFLGLVTLSIYLMYQLIVNLFGIGVIAFT
mgnify:CR=1 FL=1|jgi:hypothetical protein